MSTRHIHRFSGLSFLFLFTCDHLHNPVAICVLLDIVIVGRSGVSIDKAVLLQKLNVFLSTEMVPVLAHTGLHRTKISYREDAN